MWHTLTNKHFMDQYDIEFKLEIWWFNFTDGWRLCWERLFIKLSFLDVSSSALALHSFFVSFLYTHPQSGWLEQTSTYYACQAPSAHAHNIISPSVCCTIQTLPSVLLSEAYKMQWYLVTVQRDQSHFNFKMAQT